ncbi:MAG: relaxase/mobilization nuclease domain-containing protein [Clostridia bacterium]|nr:relaxase/mobilization nuclease domain-containing protein [Clostridia bacterium]
MAATRIISMHVNIGKTIAQCLTDRTGYAMNPDKTENGELISSYACDPHTADAEFLFAKRQYWHLTGREQRNDVIAYQVRQSFKSGEVTPEEANRIGYEFAQRFLKGKHAFIVATHTDKKHIHNHIIWNSTTLDCKNKFRDFLGSGKAVASLSDTICLEHKLSVIENPKRGNHSYNKWLGDKAQLSHRELLRAAIDDGLQKKPDSFEAFLKLMEAAGYTVKIGKNIIFSHPDFQRNIRMGSLGKGYTEEEIRAVIGGQKHHSPRKRRVSTTPQKTSLLIDIQAKLDEGKGIGYQKWATVFNLKQMAQTVLYLQEHDMADYSELAAKADEATAQMEQLHAEIKRAEDRMSEIAVLKTHIINYSKTRQVYIDYRKSGYSKKFKVAHEQELLRHKAAKQAFDDLGLKKLPTVKSLYAEYSELLAQKKAAYAKYHDIKKEQRELLIHRANVERILEIDRAEEDRKRHQNRTADSHEFS